MIRALEARLAAWVADRLETLGQQSGWLGTIYTDIGVLNNGQGRRLNNSDVLVQIQVAGLAPAVGGTAPSPDQVVGTCRISLRLLGQTSHELGGGAAGSTATSESDANAEQSNVHAIDLAAFTLLAGLKEPPVAAPSGAAPDPARPAPVGTIAIQAGTSSAALAWTDLHMVSTSIVPLNDEGLRQWDIPLEASFIFRMSPLRTESAFIRRAPQAVNVIKPPEGT